MTAHRIRIAHSLETLASALIVLALSVAGFSDAQAAPIIIDTFVDNQFAPPDSQIDAPGAIGGTRLLSADGQVVGSIGGGVWVSTNFIAPAGVVEVTYDAGGAGLGIDLTDGGANTQFELDVVFASTTGEKFGLFINDSNGVQSTYSEFWVDLPGISCFGAGDDACVNAFGVVDPLLIPFADLTGGADLKNVKSIRVQIDLPDPFRPATMIISDFRVVPEPGTALLMGLGLAGLRVVRRSRREELSPRA